MKLLIIIALGVILCSAAEIPTRDRFTANVYKKIAKKQSGTFLVCPVSVKLALSLTYLGAKGKTAQELANVLDLPKNTQKLQKLIQQLVPQLQGNKDYQLKSANKIYLQNGFAIKNQFKTQAISIFKAEIQNINFGNSPKAAKEINGWVEERTNKKIKDMVSARELNGLTALVLINAMYFHGKWVTKFKKEITTERSFFRSPNDTVSIDMMRTMSTFNYYDNLKLSAAYLELPYNGGDITMTLVLPHEHGGLPRLEDRIAEVLLPVKYHAVNISVVIPKFKVETTTEFKPILRDLGIKAAFSPSADFTGMANAVPSISKVIQKTFMEVDEEGTTAAVATAGRSLRESGARAPYLLKVSNGMLSK